MFEPAFLELYGTDLTEMSERTPFDLLTTRLRWVCARFPSLFAQADIDVANAAIPQWAIRPG